MPRIDVRCADGHENEVMRPLAMYPATPDCPECGKPTEQFHAPPRTVFSVDPVVLFQGPDGQVRFVGDANGISAHDYAAKGFTRIEIRGAAEMRRFEKHMNQHEYSRAALKVEREQEARERRESESHAQLRHGLEQGFMVPELDRDGNRTGRMTRVHLSERGRAMVKQQIERAANRPRLRVRDPGFHSDVYANDRSNRDESRDPQGRRRRD